MRELGKIYPFKEDEKKTKDRILLSSARLFALRGYADVSMRDIADASGIRPAAIYNHYKGKECVLKAVIEECMKLLQMYYSSLEIANKKAESFEEIVDNLFVELKNVTTEYIYYGLTVAMNTQFQYQNSRTLFYDMFLMQGREIIEDQLLLAIDNGFVEPFDTRALSSLISSSVITGNMIRVGTFNGVYKDFDFETWYTEQSEFIINTVKGKGLC